MSQPSNYTGNNFKPILLNINPGEQVSNSVELYGTTAVGLFLNNIPVSTSLSFQSSYDNILFYPIIDKTTGNPISYLLYTSGLSSYPLFAPDFFAWRYLKIVTSSVEPDGLIIAIIPGAV